MSLNLFSAIIVVAYVGLGYAVEGADPHTWAALFWLSSIANGVMAITLYSRRRK